MDYQIITYGNGEILKGVFDAVAMCLNSHNGSLFQPLMRLGLGVGSLWGLAYVIWGDYMKALSGWLIPLFVIISLLLVPHTRVFIKDPVFNYNNHVDHVPFGLAMSASLISKLGHGITENIEKIFTQPDDLKYQKTGCLFAANLIQHAKTFRITNEDLASNMREFVGHCVAYDAMLGRKYTIDDLRHTDDIWELVSTRASPVRSFVWRQPHNLGEPAARPEIMTCREGVARFNRLWGIELDRTATLFGQKIFGKNGLIHPKVALLQHLQSSYDFLLNNSKSALEVMKQHMMIYAVVDGIEQKSVALGNAPNFAARRAYLQQRSTYETLGAMAGETLPAMKAVLEAIAYSSFIFVIPLAVLPFGWRFFFSWVQTLLWLQMWAPLYAILNYIMTMAARSKSLAALSLSNEAGVTIASSVGLINANADIAAMAGYLAMSIPFLAIALVKGVSSFVHMASHLGNVSQGAASMAAGEVVSGNYSFGNITEGNRQIANTNMLSHSAAASYRSGMFSQSDGRTDMITTADGQQIVNVGNSNVPVSVNVAETESAIKTEQSSRSYQKAIQQAETSGISLGQTLRGLEEVSRQEGHTQNLSDQISHGKTIDQSNSVTKVGQIVRDFAKNHNLSEEQAANVIGQASINGKIFGSGTSLSASIDGKAVSQKAIHEAYKISQDEQFQQATREAVQAVQNQSYTQNDEESKRRSESISTSWENSQNLRTEASRSFRESEDLQRQASWIKSNASTINTNFTQQAIEGVANMPADNAKGRIGMQGVAYMAAHSPELLQKYVGQWVSQQGVGVSVPSELKHFERSSDHLQRSYQSDQRHLSTGDSLRQYETLSAHPNIQEINRGGSEERSIEHKKTDLIGFQSENLSELQKAPQIEQRHLGVKSSHLESSPELQKLSQTEKRPINRGSSYRQEKIASTTPTNRGESKGAISQSWKEEQSLVLRKDDMQQVISKPLENRSTQKQEKNPSIKQEPTHWNTKKMEALAEKVQAMQTNSSDTLRKAEKQHQQQQQGIEKEFHKKENKNLLRVATKAQLKNLGDTVAAPFEGGANLLKKLTGESQKKP
jgi:conjugal transfer mating pair stabilization protein TraG